MNISGYLTIFGSMLVAILLMLLPMPVWLSLVWPPWIVLVLAYWMLALPHRVGLWSAFVVGLWLDVFNNTLFGQHALALIMVAFVLDKMHHRLRLFDWWQQSICVALLTLLYGLSLYAVQCYLQLTPVSWQHWLPVVAAGVVWPVVFWLLRYFRQKFRIT
jgi:rod shape-determining protein MreD